MKNFLLSALVLGTSLTASAQKEGWTASPIGATGKDAITITFDPAKSCQNKGDLTTVQIFRYHSGINGFKNVVGATGTNDDVVGFTKNANGTWSKTLTPSDYYVDGGYAGDGSDITTLDMAINGGPANDIWSIKTGLVKPADPTDCGDVNIPLPVAAPFGVTATKAYVNQAFLISPAYPNPTTGESSFRVTLKQAGNVLVTVKNILGQTVATLGNSFEVAGVKTYSWNAASSPAGIYFYTVDAAGFTASAKINVVK